MLRLVHCLTIISTLLLHFSDTSTASISRIIDADGDGDGTGNALAFPYGIAVDSSDNVYVTGVLRNNVFRITPGGIVTEIINKTGGGLGNSLNGANFVAAGDADTVYFTGRTCDARLASRTRSAQSLDAMQAASPMQPLVR